MKKCMTLLAFLLASTLCGCTVLPGSAAEPGSPAAKLQTVLQGHGLTVTEYTGILQVHGFVNTFKEINAVEALINDYAVRGDLDFAGRIVNRVVLYADYDCHASDECFVNDNCFGDLRCLAENGCNTFDECL